MNSTFVTLYVNNNNNNIYGTLVKLLKSNQADGNYFDKSTGFEKNFD